MNVRERSLVTERRIEMKNEYTSPEVIEVGEATDAIRGAKDTLESDNGVQGLMPDNDLDD
jgi:hypothetical protein